jgi:protein-S-isoprenylcysteine O-methyltransferase Ste14
VTKVQRGRLSATALFLENWAFPLLFAYFAFVHINVLWGFRHVIVSFFATCLDDGLDMGDVNFAMFFLLRLLMIALNVGFAVGLTTRERTDHEFDDWRDVVIPLVATSWGFYSGAIMYAHSRINVQLLPTSFGSGWSSLGLLIVLGGAVVSVVGTWQLKRSFSVYVESHPVVDHGLYGVMRHPIYLGHGLRLVGYCLMSGFLLYVAVSVSMLMLLFYRAQLEERKLSRSEPGYRDYSRRTPSLAQRFFGRSAPRAAAVIVAAGR